MSQEIVGNVIVAVLALVGGAGFWQYVIARRRAPIDQQEADIAGANTTVGMTLAFAQQLNTNYTRISTELENARAETAALAERFRVLEEALRHKERDNTRLSGIVQEFNLSWDDLETRWSTHRLADFAPTRPIRHRNEILRE